MRQSSLLLCYGCLFALAAIALGFGGVEPFIRPLGLIIGAGLCFVIGRGHWQAGFILPKGRFFWAPLLLIGWILIWVFLQTTTFMPDRLHHPAWATLGQYLNDDVEGRIAINVFAARQEITWYGLYALFFASAFLFSRSRTAAATFIDGFLWMQLALAVFAVVLMAFPVDSFLGIYRRGYDDSFTSTLINRNSYAGLVGMGLCVAVSSLIMISREAWPGDSRSGMANMRKMLSGQRKRRLLCLAALIFFLFFVLVGTKSRGGLGTSLIGVAAIIFAAAYGHIKARTIGLLTLGFIAILIAISSSDILVRAQPDVLINNFSVRLNIIEMSWRMFADRPLLGTGLGSFADVATQFMEMKDVSRRVLLSAHNTYLEVLIELGLLGALPVFLLTGLTCGYAALRKASAASALSLALMGICVQLALHSLFDFTLEIPVNTAAFAMLIGAGCGQRYYSGLRKTRGRLASP